MWTSWDHLSEYFSESVTILTKPDSEMLVKAFLYSTAVRYSSSNQRIMIINVKTTMK